MYANAMTEKFEHIELFGKPVLFANARVDKTTVPNGWYRYNIRGSDQDPGRFGTLEREVAVDYAGTILSPEEIPFPEGQDYKPIDGSQNFLGEDMTLAEFCAYHDIPIPENPQKYLVRPAPPEEAGLFYAQTPEQDETLGAIGHVRIDFGHGGREFWHTWHPRGAEELNSPEFKAELDEVVGQLRESVLQDLSSMRSYCYHHGGEIEGGICTQNYGYTVETDRYRYLLRCNPIEGDYQAYLSCFDKQAQEQAAQQASFPDGWREGDICYLITNKAKQYTQPYTVESFDGTYFGVRGRTGSYHRASPGRMFRTREDAVASLMGTTPKEKYDHPDTIKDVDEDKARDPGQKMPLGGRGSFASGDQMQGTTDLKITDYFGNPVTLRPRIELYSVTDFMGEELPGLAIVLDKIGDSPIELEQYAFLTVSFGEHISIKNSAYVDTNNCPFAEQLLEQGIAEPTGLCKTSGFCKYPLWVFKEEFLQTVGGENYQEYAKIYDQHMNPSEENEEPFTMTMGGM